MPLKILTKKKVYLIITAFSIAGLGFIFGCLFRNAYGLLDNYFISLVINRIYDIDNYCLHIHPILCFFLGKLSDLMPFADVFLLFMRIVLFSETVWLSYLLLSSTESKPKIIINVLFVLFLILSLNLYTENYTVYASSLIFTGLLTLLLALHNDKNVFIHLPIGTLFVCLGFMTRYQTGLLLVPFLLLEIITTLIDHRNNLQLYIKKYIRYFAPCIILCIILFVSMTLVKTSDKYSDGFAYDNARVAVLDYPMKEWEEVSSDIPDVTKTEYTAATGWILADTEIINTSLFEKIAEVGSKTQYSLSLKGISSAFAEMFGLLFKNKIIAICIFFAVILFIYILIHEKSLLKKAESLFAILGTQLIIFYYTFIGRAIDRVYIAVLLGALLILLYIFIQEDKEKKEYKKKYISTGIYALIITTLAFGITYNLFITDFSTPQLSISAGKDTASLSKDYTGDDILIWSDLDMYNDYMHHGKLPTKEIISHNLIVGNWVYGQAYHQNMLDRIGVPNPMKALIAEDNVYYASNDYTFILEFLQEHYGQNGNIAVYQKGEIKGTPIWGFKQSATSK